MEVDRIAVYGATGATGRRIAAELIERGRDVVLGGRDREKLEALAARWGGDESRIQIAEAEIGDEAAFARMLSGAAVVINCAGPFRELGKPVVEAAMRAGCHYLDISGEQAHIRWVAECCDEQARAKQLVLMPSCAFEFALGDLAAEIAWTQAASRIVVAYVLEDLKFSQGTKKALIRSFADGGVTFINGQYCEKHLGYRLFDVPVAPGVEKKGAWVPGGEAITVPRRGGVSRVETCVVVNEGMAYFAATFSGVLPAVLRQVQPLADRVVDRGEPGREELGEGEGTFQVVAFDPKSSRAYITLQGRDMYETTARIAVEAAERILTADRRRVGFMGPADLFEPREFLQALGIEMHS